MERNERHEERDAVKINEFQGKCGGLLETVHVDLLLRRDCVGLRSTYCVKTNGWNVGDHDELVVGRDRIERTHGVEQMQRVVNEERNVQ